MRGYPGRGEWVGLRTFCSGLGPRWADTAGHVNNTIHWAAAEDALVGRDWVPAHAEIEYHQPILPGCEPRLVTSRSPGQLEV